MMGNGSRGGLSQVRGGRPSAEYDEIFGESLTFSPDGVMEYLATQDDSLCRVKYIPAP